MKKAVYISCLIAMLGIVSCKDNTDAVGPEGTETDTTIVRETPPGDATDVNAGPATDSITGTGKPVE